METKIISDKIISLYYPDLLNVDLKLIQIFFSLNTNN